MRYLLDTHALLWFLEGSPRLPDPVAAIIEGADTQKAVSVASLWEATIKISLGKLQVEGGIEDLWEAIVANGFTILPIQEPYLTKLAQLPFIHRDPFDRLLIATALAEGLTLITSDQDIRKYDMQWAWG